MLYDSTRVARLAGLITEDYRGTIDLNSYENVKEEKENLFETRLRNEIRKEIRKMLSEMEENDIGSDWILSSARTKKSNSRKGSVAQGFVGLGFKNF